MVISRSFNGWRANAAEQKANRVKIQRAVARWQRLQVMSVFNKWADTAYERQLCRRTMTKLLRRYTLNNHAKGFNSWRSYLLYLTDHNRQELVIARVLARMKRLAATRAFESWAENVAEIRIYRQRVRLVRGCFVRGLGGAAGWLDGEIA